MTRSLRVTLLMIVLSIGSRAHEHNIEEWFFSATDKVDTPEKGADLSFRSPVRCANADENPKMQNNHGLAPQSCNNWARITASKSGIQIGDLDVSGDKITVEAVFNRTAPYSGSQLYAGDLVSKHSGPPDVNYLLRPNSAEITTTNGYFKTPDVCDIQLNKTYHVALVYDGKQLLFYRNGFLMSKIACTGNLYQNNYITAIGTFSFNPNITNENLVGYINEVRIWKIARTQSQIKTYMNQPLPNPASQTGLLAYYTFDNLKNKQGNSQWDGALIGNATINQTNPICPIFVADSCGKKVNCTGFIVNAGNDTSTCAGSSVQLQATGADTYIWNSSSELSDTTISNPIASPKGTTRFIVRGSSNTGCADIDTVKVAVLQSPVVSVTNDTSICTGDSVLLQATGAGIRSYQWMPATGLSSTSIYDPVATPVVSTKYFVRVADSQNCRNIDSVFVYVEPNPVFDINPKNTAICDGDSVELTASGGNNYKWSPTSSLTKPNSAATMALPKTKTVYEVIVLNTICRASDTLYSVVDINPPPVITISKSNDIDCDNLQAQLNAGGGISYDWSPPSYINDTQVADPIVNPPSGTWYSVAVAAANGCTATDSILVRSSLEIGGENFYVPNAFSPNGDGVNDCFGVHYWGSADKFEMFVYNRWGQLIYHSLDVSGCWDGTLKGTKQSAGTYVYLITVSSACSHGTIQRQGTVVLVR